MKIILQRLGLLSFARRLYKLFSSVLIPLEYMILNITGHIPSHHIRNLIYRLFGMKVGKGSHIYGGAEIRSPYYITIGKGSSIGHHAILDGRGRLTIGNNVNLSTGVWIWTAQHDVNDLHFKSYSVPVIIGDFAWLSCRTTILPGVTIGEGAVVAAGAVVTKDVEPYTIVGGIPAQKIGERPHGLQYELSEYIHMI
jgi:acetyltransferase-like isoleucine patch superfamily enzyme